MTDFYFNVMFEIIFLVVLILIIVSNWSDGLNNEEN